MAEGTSDGTVEGGYGGDGVIVGPPGPVEAFAGLPGPEEALVRWNYVRGAAGARGGAG